MEKSDTALVRLGQFSFRYRGLLLPVAIVLLLVPGPKLVILNLGRGALAFARRRRPAVSQT